MFEKFYSLIFAVMALCLVSCGKNPVLERDIKSPEISKSTVELSLGGRVVDVLIWTPASDVEGHIFFSHGAASAPEKYEALILPWVERGYLVYAPLHVDSTDHPETEKYQGLASWRTRLEDARLVADYMDADSYIAAGHSYGALLALTIGGAQPAVPGEITQKPQDSRASLVLAFSPPGTIPNFVTKEAYSSIAVPTLIQTGTLDVPIGSNQPYLTHLDAFHAVPEGSDVFGLVLEGVDHYFGGAFGRLELEGPKQQAQLETALDISNQMIDAYVAGDAKSLKALTSQLSAELPTQFMRK